LLTADRNRLLRGALSAINTLRFDPNRRIASKLRDEERKLATPAAVLIDDYIGREKHVAALHRAYFATDGVALTGYDSSVDHQPSGHTVGHYRFAVGFDFDCASARHAALDSTSLEFQTTTS
jgi:hypothetical protein